LLSLRIILLDKGGSYGHATSLFGVQQFLSVTVVIIAPPDYCSARFTLHCDPEVGWVSRWSI